MREELEYGSSGGCGIPATPTLGHCSRRILSTKLDSLKTFFPLWKDAESVAQWYSRAIIQSAMDPRLFTADDESKHRDTQGDGRWFFHGLYVRWVFFSFFFNYRLYLCVCCDGAGRERGAHAPQYMC